MHYKERSSSVTLYTENGPVSAEHLECRCKSCSRGYFYGYYTDKVDTGSADEDKTFKYYEEDCLESQVSLKGWP